jgi:hypothetical protein
MTTQQQIILDTVTQNGGSCDWNTLIAAVDYPYRQTALSDVRVLEQGGHLQRVVARNADTGKVELTISLAGA